MKRRILIILLALLIGGRAHASLVVLDFLSVGDGLVTKATSTGYEWLDLDFTAGVSYDNVMNGYGNLIDNGFRYATSAEVFSLWNDQGIVDIGGMGFNANQQAMVSSLQSLLGYTYVGPNHKETVGITSDLGIFPGTQNMSVLSSGNTPNTFYWAAIEWPGPSHDFSDIEVGSYLVRETAVVPLPAAAFLMLSGLLTLVTYTRKS